MVRSVPVANLAVRPSGPAVDLLAPRVARQADRAANLEAAVSPADLAARQGAASPAEWVEVADSRAAVRPAAVDADVNQRAVKFSMRL